MRLLVDTNVFLWLVLQAPIPRGVLTQLEDPANDLLVSLVTPWEMQIKVGVGKLSLAGSVQSVFETQLAVSNMGRLPITIDHIDALGGLPHYHRDPFDRLLVAQALHEDLTLVTSDQHLRRYEIPVLWE